jgi:hypothetical protein
MTPEEAKEAMKRILKLQEDEGDTESFHFEADLLLCDILKDLGYSETVELFKKLPKWYA